MFTTDCIFVVYVGKLLFHCFIFYDIFIKKKKLKNFVHVTVKFNLPDWNYVTFQ